LTIGASSDLRCLFIIINNKNVLYIIYVFGDRDDCRWQNNIYSVPSTEIVILAIQWLVFLGIISFVFLEFAQEYEYFLLELNIHYRFMRFLILIFMSINYLKYVRSAIIVHNYVFCMSQRKLNYLIGQWNNITEIKLKKKINLVNYIWL